MRNFLHIFFFHLELLRLSLINQRERKLANFLRSDIDLSMISFVVKSFYWRKTQNFFYCHLWKCQVKKVHPEVNVENGIFV